MLRQLACCTLLSLATQAFGQDRMPPPNGPPMDEIAMAVGLKDSQKASVQKILEQHHAAMVALHEAMRSKQDALEQQTHASLSKVLTPTQLARFEQWHQMHRPPPPEGPGGQGMGTPRGPGLSIISGSNGPGMGGPGGYGPQGRGGPGGYGPPGMGGYGGPDGQRPPPPPGGSFGPGQRPPPPPYGGYGQGNRPPPPPDGNAYSQPYPPQGGQQ